MTAPDPLLSEVLAEARKCLLCLYIEVEESIARDVESRVEAAFRALVERVERADRLRDEAKSGADMLAAIAGDLDDGFSIEGLRGKYLLAVVNARDDLRAALSAYLPEPSRTERAQDGN